MAQDRTAGTAPWVLLGGIVVLSIALRLWLVRGMVAPFVFVDEAIYTELARSVAESGSYAVRGASVSGYSLLYPLLIAPAYGLLDSLVDAYAAAKATNAVAMSLAAVPAYLLGRRVVGQWLALLGAAIAVAVPSMAYTGTITTESLFYPVALAFVLAFVAYLGRPDWRRLALLAVAFVAALTTRSQSIAFLPAVATAPVVLALLRRRLDTLRPFVPAYVLGLAGFVVIFVAQTARGRSLTDLLGAYRIVGEGGYDVGEALRFWLWHVEELDLYVGILPFAALLVVAARGRLLPRVAQEHVAATVSLLVWSTLAVGTFASRFASDRVQDRYLFFLTPLLVVCLLMWVEHDAARPAVATALAGAAALALPLVFPYTRFIGEPAKSDTLGLIPLWSANEHLVGGRYWLTVGVVGLGLVVLWLGVRGRWPVVAPIVVLALFAVLSRPVWSGPHGFLAASRGALFQGVREVDRDWIDEAVPNGDEVVALWTGRADRFTVNQSEFFNRRVERVLYTDQPTPGGINETAVVRDDDSGRLLADGRPVRAPYALLDGSVTPDGVAVARDEGTGMTLWRLTEPLSSRATITGLYGDTWSGPRVTWRLLRCKRGILTVTVHSDPSLFDRPQQLHVAPTSATATEVPIGASTVPSDGDRTTLTVPVVPSSGVCTVDFEITPTANPSQVIPGSSDDRELGLHFDAFAYQPDR